MAACAGDDIPPAACPEVAVIDGLEAVTYYDPPASESLETLDFSIALQNILGGCSYTEDAVGLSMSIDIVARFGPAFDQASLDIPYFVVVRDETGELVRKDEFRTTIAPRPGAASAGNREFFEQQVFGVTTETGPQHSILFGLELDRETALRNLEAR